MDEPYSETVKCPFDPTKARFEEISKKTPCPVCGATSRDDMEVILEKCVGWQAA